MKELVRTLDHSVFFMDGSSHSYHRALHCLGVLRARREDMRAHWFLPYFAMAALRTSSSVFWEEMSAGQRGSRDEIPSRRLFRES